MPAQLRPFIWIGIAVLGAACLGGIALNRGETINAIWFIGAAAGVYALAYRFYAGWIAARLMVVDSTRATPAERLNDGRDFVPTHKWITFGHHFAAIAGAGPLVGPTLAMQFGYMPGTLWLLVGAVFGGCVQDMVILFCSTRRNGRSLGQMARDELGPVAGSAALLGTLMIMVLIVAVLGLVVVNAMKHSPWGTSTVFATIPIAILVGVYMRNIRPGRVLEGSLIGLALLLLATAGGGWLDHSPLRSWFDYDGTTLALFVIGYGFLAAILPVWLLLAPRDYISTFIKIGAILLLAFAVVILQPEMKMPAFSRFTDGTGPVVAGNLFPFLFITIACGAISGFHALISSGTTPKLIANERDIPMIGYGSMLMESFVGLMALIAAAVLDPGVYFAINSPSGVVGRTVEQAVATISGWGFPVTAETMNELAREMGETTLLARTGGAPSLAVGMATIFAGAFGKSMLALWYHFAIMFEAMFILTAVDAGTRVGRFMLQDMLSNIWKPFGDTKSFPMTMLSSALFVAMWGYFLYIGVIDPLGGINILWPLFGISNQMLAAIALAVATCIFVKSGKARYVWVTAVPMVAIALTTTYAAWEKLFSADPRVGFLAGADALAQKLAAGQLTGAALESAPKLIFNQRLDAALTVFFVIVLWVVIVEATRLSLRHLRGEVVPPLTEHPWEPRTAGGNDD
ncbi:carbon starvation CstA family protein [Azospirillum thermophilum]|uniref:Carbon starvation protein A n=1 Tax=Azospirillum thermophilum TaxID=2202148 RepID=A0A2S2CYV5_9PROT|nr:carbon starvation CstA family protein [Azospirillum thermophilum]AWK89658.1 carbon starvation protein A [Azospirillum thermophilum]